MYQLDYDELVQSWNKTLEVLALFGFTKPSRITLENFTHTHNVRMGEEVEFSFDITSPVELKKLRIEFVMGFLRKNNQHNKKVFKIAEGTYKEMTKAVSKTYSFRPISTRVYYKGEQKLSVLINGVVFKEVTFELV